MQGEVAATIENGDPAPLPDRIPGPVRYLDTQLGNGEPAQLYQSALTEGRQQLGTMVPALPLASAEAASRQVLTSLGIAIPAALLLSACGGLFLAGRALSTVADIAGTAQQVSAADLTQRLSINLPDDEIGRLARIFNAMLERLDEAFRREKQFMADASHELRTRLGMMKAQISLARSRPRRADKLLEMLIDLEGDVDRMTQLVEQMLTLARGEQREPRSPGVVDMNELLPSVIGDLQRHADGQHISLDLATPSRVDLRLPGDRDRLRQVFVNLLENGPKYTPNGGHITVSAGRS